MSMTSMRWRRTIFFGLEQITSSHVSVFGFFKEKKPEDHYSKHYDLQKETLHFQTLDVLITLMHIKNMFSIVGVCCMMLFGRCFEKFMYGNNMV